ncbi:MAG: hypothetical protein APF81_24310 [Desulfosporosinus sp. BRH_c37]|nr:MAG: hypothetical protein APF81_24310 [Desulfosporosinus sp. BRH_c37]
MKKEYVTVRLFKNNRAADDLITETESFDSDQLQSPEARNISLKNYEAVESSANSSKSLPQRLLNVIQRALAELHLDRKG